MLFRSGVIGLACAWRAAQRGLDVCVLDRAMPGAAASRVAAGMLVPVTEVEFGEESLLELKLASARAYPDFVAELQEASGCEVEYHRDGALNVALDHDEVEELCRLHVLQIARGLDVEWLTPSACRELEPGLTPSCAGGVFARDDAHVDPRTVTAALAAALGDRVVSGAEVVGAILDGDRILGVETADGRSFHADRVVLACGAWSGVAEWLPEQARPPVRPVKGQILELRGPASAPLCALPVHTERVYVVPWNGGRVVVGASVEERGFDTTITAGAVHELLREAYRALPGIDELELVEVRAGLRPFTPDKTPLIGPGALEGLILATGHGRHGILLAPVTAERVAELLTRGTDFSLSLTAGARP